MILRASAIRPAVLFVIILAAACTSAPPPESKDAAIRKGDELLNAEKFVAAVAAYQAAVKIDPRDGEIRMRLSQAHLRAGQWAEATREGILAGDLLPGNRKAQTLAASSLLQQGRFGDAAERASRLLKESPNDAVLLVLFGNAKAQLLNSYWVLWSLGEALRRGTDFEVARLHLRPKTARSDDRIAEEAFRKALKIDPEMSDARMGFAGFLWAAGLQDEAAQELKRNADEDPKHALLSRLLGVVYAAQGRHPDAEKYLKQAAATGERDSRLTLADYYISRRRYDDALPLLEPIAASDDMDGAASLRAADIELRLGKPERALVRADAMLAREPGHARALRIKAAVLFAAGDFAQALTAGRLAVIADPYSREARSLVAESLKATGDLERAFNEFAEAWRLNTRDAGTASQLGDLALSLGRNQVALEFATQSIRLDPTNRGASITLAKALARTGDFQAAERTLSPLLATQPSSPELLVLQAEIQVGQGKYDAATATYSRAIRADRDSLDALSGLVDLEIAGRHAARVRPQVDQAVGRHPKDPRYLILAAKVAKAQDDAPRAESVLKTILDIDPAHVDAALLLAEVLIQQGRRDDAKRALDQALTRHPASTELRLSLADLLDGMGRPAEARPLYEAIVAEKKGAFAVSAKLAALYADQGINLDVALDLATFAKKNLPKDPFVSDTLGWVYVRKKLTTRGLPHLLDALAAQPSNARVRYHLGVAYETTGAIAKAREELSRALALDPGFAGAEDARRILRTLGK